MAPNIDTLMDGYNVTLFAYGMTGAGKTYTMLGLACIPGAEMGVTLYTLEDIFLRVS